jgi:5-methylcytosine-specific restriction endonuclease McrA
MSVNLLYERLGTVPPIAVLPYLRNKRHSKEGPRHQREYFGAKVYMDSPRYHTFKEKGCKCVRCGLEGTYFAVERQAANGNSNPDRYHLNLYGMTSNCEEVMLTVDHILPESRGGKRHVDNLQPMCRTCNSEKKNIPDAVDALNHAGVTLVVREDIVRANPVQAIDILIPMLTAEQLATAVIRIRENKT